MGRTIMHVAYAQWINAPDQTPFQQIARRTLAQFRELAATA
jgi:hypothetical protein